ncbi:MAG: hypothetical protein H6895_07730 [Defluviimonas sp.]|uniref:alpha/beta hydrolase family esterase n=1 Tax=Albidovulum sp. TaxID=1872424 RepID=UPI002A264D67|nr:hypothetical protein [Defluviimonas sp.]
MNTTFVRRARLGLALVAALCVAAAAGAADFTRVEMGAGRYYLVALPKTTGAPPVVVALHGGGGNPAQFAAASGFADAALARGFAVVLPAGTAGRPGGRLLVWNGLYCCGHAPADRIDDLGFLDRVIDDATGRYGLDRGRVFMAGMSNGGIMAETYAALHPERLRAVGSVAGTFDARHITPKAPVPLLHMHGTRDDHLPYAGGVGQKSYVRTDFAPVETAIAAFRKAARGPLVETDATLDRADDGMSVDRRVWAGPGGRPQVVLYTIRGGGHVWPGGPKGGRRGATRDVSANAALLDFFEAWF